MMFSWRSLRPRVFRSNNPTKESKMKNEKNTLMGDAMSKNQMSPGLADPRDFVLIEAGDAPKMPTPFHGQSGTSTAEYEKLLRQGEEAANASAFSEQGEVHPDVNNSAPPHTP